MFVFFFVSGSQRMEAKREEMAALLRKMAAKK